MNNIILYSLFFFSFFFIIGSKFENINIYASSIICFIYILYTFLNIIKTKSIRINITKRELILVFFLVIYIIYTLVLGLYVGVENRSIYKVLFNSLYMVTFILILINSVWDYNFSSKFAKMFGYSLIIMGLMGILMYILKIYAIRISFTPPFLHFYDAGKMLDYFGEIRFQSIFSHKTKYAYYCLIGIFILRINTCLSKKIRVLGILILTINIVLTNSIMSLIATIILLVSFINFKKINKYFRHIIFCIAVVAIIVSGIMVYNYTSDVRDLGSWGSRKIIWESAIEFFKGHPIGVIDNWYFYRLDNHFQGAHNVFLDELLDYGIVGGGLFLIIYFGIFYNLFKIDKRTLGLFLATTILFMVDNLLYYDIVPVFWLSYLVIKIISQNNNRLSGIGNR